MISENEIPLSKILKPTYEEFVDFAQFVETLDDKSLQNYGLVKVVPPAKWKARKSGIDFDSFVVNAPIEQNVQGKSGVYELLLIQKKSMKLLDYKKKVECFDAITTDKCLEDVEDMFWRSLAFSPPLYGADMAGSLFDVGVPWNLNELPGVLKEGLKNPISGVNHPYLYVGSWKTMFGWHKEDLDLFSINYLHYGKPKFWYGIPASEGKKLENFARSYFPEGFSKCKEFLRHKTIMIHPYILKQKIPDLKIHKMVQYPGEFMITIGGAYHAGFNWGFNIAEAVNFATTKWLEILPNVRACTCIKDSVKIGKEDFYYNMLESSVYGKMAHVRKICNDQGVHITKPLEEDEVESTETTDSREVQPMRRTRLRSTDTTTQYKEVPTRLTRNSGPKLKTISKKNLIEPVDGEDDTPRQRMSNRSKKIKKLGEEFDTSDWKKNQKPKKGQVQNFKKGRLRKVKDLGEVNDDQDLIPFDDN